MCPSAIFCLVGHGFVNLWISLCSQIVHEELQQHGSALGITPRHLSSNSNAQTISCSVVKFSQTAQLHQTLHIHGVFDLFVTCTCTWRGMLVLLCEGYMLSGLCSLKISKRTDAISTGNEKWKKTLLLNQLSKLKIMKKVPSKPLIALRWAGAMFHLIVKRLRFLQTVCNH